ncbi:MAG TPA: hypothetical protein VM489_05070 [Burkholderiales bacterium]|nr:hypothetical protein [Burkholderiales bacterium]
MSLLVELADAPALQEHYAVLERPVANLGMDLLIPPLAALGMELEAAGRAFVGLTLALFCTGVVVLGWASQRRPPWLALLVFAFAYNLYVIYGFLNYFFGLGMAFLTLALWIRTPALNPWIRLAIFSALGTLLLAIHLMAFGVYGLAVAAWAAGERGFSPRRLAEPLAQFIVPVLLYLTAFQHTGGFDFYYDDPVKSKLLGAAGLFLGYSRLADGALALAVLAGAAWLVLRRRWTLPCRGAGAALATMTAAFIALPFYAMGSWMLDSRLSVPVLALALAFVALPPLEAASRRTAIVLAVCLGALVVPRTWTVATHWQVASNAFAEVRAALAAVTPGARVATVQIKSGVGVEFPPLRHAAAFAVVDRHAMIPNLFAYPFNGESVAFREHLLPIAARHRFPTLRGAERPDWDSLAANFDYVLVIGLPLAAVPGAFRPLTGGNGFHLVKSPRP